MSVAALVGCQTAPHPNFTAKEAAAKITASLPDPKALDYWDQDLAFLKDKQGHRYYLCCLSNGDRGGLGLFDPNGLLLSFEPVAGINNLEGVKSVLCRRDSVLIRTRSTFAPDILRLKYQLFTLVDGKLKLTFECRGEEEIAYGESDGHFATRVRIRDNKRFGRRHRLVVTTMAKWFVDWQNYARNNPQHRRTYTETFSYNPQRQQFDWSPAAE